MFEHAGVRGELVEISNAWQQIQARHEYPAAVKTILGELTAARKPDFAMLITARKPNYASI